MRRSDILDPSKNVLAAGTLIVEVQIKVRLDMSRPCLPYFPPLEARSGDRMKALFNLDEKFADVIFEFRKDDMSNVVKCHAHRAVLQAWAPGLADICEPYLEKSCTVPIENVSPEVFKLLLSYIYGVDISVADWKAYAKELLEAADFYSVPSLKIAAEQWYRTLSLEVTSENVMDLLAYAEAKNCSELKESAMDFFVEKGADAISCRARRF